MDPDTMFVYGIRSPYTKESYLRRLHIFFDAIDLGKVKHSRSAATVSLIKQEQILTGHLVMSLDSCIIKKKEWKRRRSQQAHYATMSRQPKCFVR
jgi:hypothetical protein